MNNNLEHLLPFWHKESYDHFIQEQLPELLDKRLPLAGYQVNSSSVYRCSVTVTLTNRVTVEYTDLPQPDEQGIFNIEGGQWTVVPHADHEALERAEILCVGDMLYAFMDEHLGTAPPGLPWDQQLLRSWLPLGRWLRERFGGPSRFIYDRHFQYVDSTNWLSKLSHTRRLFVTSRRQFLTPGQMGRVCPFETPEGPNIARIFSIAVGAVIRNGKLIVEDDAPEKALGLSSTLIPCLEHNDPFHLLMGANMMRQWLPYEQPEPALVQSGNEPNVAGVWAGRNLLTAYTPWGVDTYESGIVVSESGAAKLSAANHRLEPGDKLSNRHGTKGVISRILPDHEMPLMADGTPIELLFSSSALLNRMVFGQIREALLGRIAHARGEPLIIPPFQTPSQDELRGWLAEANLPEDGLEQLAEPGTGRPLEERSTVGWVYWGHLHHLVKDKLQVSADDSEGTQRQGILDFNILQNVGALETIRGFFNTQALPEGKIDGSNSSDSLASQIMYSPVAQSGPPTLCWSELQQRLMAAGIQMNLADQKLQFNFIPDEQLPLRLAYRVRHPWLHEQTLTALGTPPDDALSMPEYAMMVDANSKVARLLEGQTPHTLVIQAVHQLQSSVEQYLDTVLNATHVQFENQVLFSGRTVLAPDGSLHYDQIGLPEEMAWTLFGPRLARDMGEDAAENRTTAATQRLDEIMAESWLIINRSPSVTETAFLAFHPVRDPDKVIRVHPLVCPLLDADFDGDQGAVFLPITRAGQQEAGTRLSLAGHLRRNDTLLGKMMPRHEALWGLAHLSQSSRGHRKIEALVGTDINASDGFITHMALLDALTQVLSRQGPEQTLTIIDQLFQQGFAVAQQSGFSVSGFMGAGLEHVAKPIRDDPKRWDASARQLAERLAAIDVNTSSLKSHLLSIKSGARGEVGTLAQIIGPQGVARDVQGNSVIIQHGYCAGLTAKELYGLVPASRERLADLAIQRAEMERPSSHATSIGNVNHSFHVLARARRTSQPGVVFARAAAIGEVDPLVDQVSRLFAGLG